ncbi:hypothetical protein [Deinococcus misasensis]|uniref:hypothetical protein n=1 Tax=Deinococcus misasensis TaxID=392413 RepID=UPI000ACCED51|nr:hypothetical protein [Deinococcus misasensis]
MITSVKRIRKIKRMHEIGQTIKNISALEGIPVEEVERILALPEVNTTTPPELVIPQVEPEPQPEEPAQFVVVPAKKPERQLKQGFQRTPSTPIEPAGTVTFQTPSGPEVRPADVKIEHNHIHVQIGEQVSEFGEKILLMLAKRSRSSAGVAAGLKAALRNTEIQIEVLLNQKLLKEDETDTLNRKLYRTSLKGVLYLREKGHAV